MTWEQFQQEAAKVSRETGYPLSVLLGQAAQETGRNVSSAPGNNFFGIKGSGNAGSQLLNTWESVGGRRVNIRDNFASYATPADAIRAYIQTIERLVPDWKNYANNPTILIQKIKAAGYATDPNYVQNVMNTPEFKNNIAQGTANSVDTKTNRSVSPKFDLYNNFVSPLMKKLIPEVQASGNQGLYNMNYTPPKTLPQAVNQNTNNPYTVKSGDTLWDIAQRYLGKGSLYPQLGYTGNPYTLPVGTRLNIPSTLSSKTASKITQGTQPGLTTNYTTKPPYTPPPIIKSLQPNFSLYPSQPSARMI